MRDMPNLDFVRSIAVISVVMEHTLLALGIQRIGPFPIPYLGVLGVLVFFVLTSLVLMWSLERKPHTLDFYIRRWFRIYPLAIVVIVAAVLTHAPTAGTPQHFFIAVYPGLKETVRQFTLLPSPGPKIVGVMWSLPYEVEMYILLPLIFFFVRRNFSLWPMLLVWGLIVMNVRSLPAEGHNFAVALAYFLPGIMAYIAFGRWKPKLPGWTLPIFVVAMWAVFLPKCNFHRGWWFCLIFGLGLPMFHQMKSPAVLACSREIAKYSYGVYLTHPFALAIGLYLLRGQNLPVRLMGEFIPLVALPILAYHLVEHPMIRLGSRLAAKAEKKYEQREIRHFREVTLT
jgi:peptidoglycan/LPS O-acetylase OafA/YrhL